METFTLEKIYKAPIDIVWKAITDREQMKKWYFDLPATFKPVVGNEFEWYGKDEECNEWLHRGKVVEMIEGKKIAHTWEYPGYTGSSNVIWELSSIDEKNTLLILTHVFNILFDTTVKALRKENFVAGWTHIVNISLTEYLEK